MSAIALLWTLIALVWLLGAMIGMIWLDERAPGRCADHVTAWWPVAVLTTLAVSFGGSVRSVWRAGRGASTPLSPEREPHA